MNEAQALTMIIKESQAMKKARASTLIINEAWAMN